MEKICRKCKKAFKFDKYEYSEPSFCSDDIEYHVVHCPHCNAENYTQEVRTEEYITEKYYSKYKKSEKKNTKDDGVIFFYVCMAVMSIVTFISLIIILNI